MATTQSPLTASCAGNGLADGAVISPVPVRSSSKIITGQPALTEEAMGWLAFLHRKVGFGGTWFKDDVVHPSWDNLTGAPIGVYHRYDLSYATMALGLMADQTPAWREEYSRILGYVADRMLEYWSHWDWAENSGPDPNRANYPDEARVLIPEGHLGKYDIPGWAANGVEPFPYDPDPVRGNGSCNLMYKGYLNLILSFYNYVSGDDRFDSPFKVVYDDKTEFEYDHRGLNELIVQQWLRNPSGLACEVTKSYPWCNNLTGLSIKLFDSMHGTNLHWAYGSWKKYLRENFMGVPEKGPIEWLSLYYDANIDVNMRGEEHQFAYNWFANAFLGYPQDTELFSRLYEGAKRRFLVGQKDGTAFMAGAPGMEVDYPYATITALTMARELGDDETYSALRAWALKTYEPTVDQERGEFYMQLGLNEPWPRGQLNDWIMPAFTITEPGAWHRLFNSPKLSKFREPTLEGVEYPTLRPRQASWDAGERALHASFSTVDRSAEGRPTSLRITNLLPGATYRITIDGSVAGEQKPLQDTLEIATTIGNHTLTVQQLSI
jgi:hypothetical protein